ncbi:MULTISPECIES: DUF4435 domain-containing protein [unclassified Pseudomonas]|uniref:DUF4435 domain-containing protein n=1 Tax=unclassified Pseudomonas TaxID=196821 RepID=UPI00128B9548|nr:MULTISPECIES: DUF4435 domain-containing protein [unclassified Pseudomonas]MPQ66540.1 DUF4435 domain-containing protein [Pseudomonas sp. MWU12-2323]
MSLDPIPSWSPAASESIGLFYRKLQPIEVYVEDSNSEAFYFELLNRMITNDRKIKKIIPLHGREHVLRHCENYKHKTPALFLIDGDLDIFFGSREKGKTNLFQHKAYCIENYLFCKEAARELILDASGTILRENALSEQEWNTMLNPLTQLKQLFITFAAARSAHSELKTVSYGFASIITQKGRKQPPVIDDTKIEQLNEAIALKCIEKIGSQAWGRIRQDIENNSIAIDPIDGVSGKDFLLPLLDHFLRSKGSGNISTNSLMFKLAKYCSLNRLQDLQKALNDVISGSSFVSH